MDKGKIGIILSQINGTDLTENCIESLKSVDYDNLSFYVGDNLSDDYSHLKLLTRFPDINLITYTKRKSYCETFNYLSKIAIEDGCEFVFIVNNDTRNFSKDYFNVLIPEFNDKNLGMVGSTCLTFDGEIRQDLNSMKNKFGHSIIVPTEGFILRTEAWKEIGGFREKLNIYTEDLKLQRDLFNSGWKIKSNHSVSFEHLAGATMSKMTFHSNYYRMRNGVYTLRILNLPLKYKIKQFYTWVRVHINNSLTVLKKGKFILAIKIILFSFAGMVAGFTLKK